MEIDARVQLLVNALDELPGIVTMSSCGGHADPGPCQAPEGEFFVCFQSLENDESWRSLELLTFVADLAGASVKAWANSGEEFAEGCLCFELAGAGVDPDLLAREILALYEPSP